MILMYKGEYEILINKKSTDLISTKESINS